MRYSAGRYGQCGRRRMSHARTTRASLQDYMFTFAINRSLGGINNDMCIGKLKVGKFYSD